MLASTVEGEIIGFSIVVLLFFCDFPITKLLLRVWFQSSDPLVCHRMDYGNCTFPPFISEQIRHNAFLQSGEFSRNIFSWNPNFIWVNILHHVGVAVWSFLWTILFWANVLWMIESKGRKRDCLIHIVHGDGTYFVTDAAARMIKP